MRVFINELLKELFDLSGYFIHLRLVCQLSANAEYVVANWGIGTEPGFVLALSNRRTIGC